MLGNVIRNGVDIRTVPKATRHSGLGTTAKCLRPDTPTKQAAVEKLNGLFGRADANGGLPDDQTNSVH
jgi:hypothetical protein